MTDWQVGDLAVCVDDGPARTVALIPPLTKLVAGRSYMITDVFAYPDQDDCHLLVDGEPPHVIQGHTLPGGWACDRFRKVLRDKHEDCEPEFVTLLKHIKRTVRAQDDAHA